MPIGTELQSLVSEIRSAGGTPYVVGGAVRDWVLGLAPKDIDLEVYGLDPLKLEKILRGAESGAQGEVGGVGGEVGEVGMVGRSFGVFKVRRGGEEFDISLPRQDSKTGRGHREFDISIDLALTPEKASERRDFTINSMLYDPVSGRLLDPHGGEDDISRKLIRHTSSAFSEDPLRVLRAVQFSARLGFDIHPETARLCRQMYEKGGGSDLPKERVLEEVRKFVTKGEHHVRGFETWEKTGWLTLFPELEAMRETIQDPHWHPEGDVLTHTGFSLQALTQIPGFRDLDEGGKFVLGMGVLCHDIGKPLTTRKEWNPKLQREVVTSHNHQVEGVAVARRFLGKLGVVGKTRSMIEGLVRFHMEHLSVNTRKDVRKLALRMARSPEGGGATISMLSLVVEADHSGRPPMEAKQNDRMLKILELAREEGCLHGPPAPLLTGLDLLKVGIPPGKIVGKLLHECYKAQVEGGILTKKEALEWTGANLRRIGSEEIKPLVTGQDLLDRGVPPSKVYAKILDQAYLMQLRGEKFELDRVLRETGSEGEMRAGLRRGKTTARSVSSPHDTFSRDR